ncbi:tRNA glutamyl-Q(34) synthetase GluQRS [Enterobacteriaceae bacterium LUAb1]
MKAPYIGRFAPSPSGELHFGSLIAALGSWLQARAQQGIWQVRIEDIDPPREIPHAASRILQQLEHFRLEWDGEIIWQSQRHDAYREVLNQLQCEGKSYYCDCPRRRIQQLGGFYDRHCRNRSLSAEYAAIRLRVDNPVQHFDDMLRGRVDIPPRLAQEDFIIHRRDGLFAYNLAVVVDDHAQAITEVVRGADLTEPTVRQIMLYRQLGWAAPRWLHLPLALDSEGNKLSKQNHAPALSDGDPRPVLVQALRFLAQPVTPGWQDISLEMLLKQAIINWRPEKLPHQNKRLSNREN